MEFYQAKYLGHNIPYFISKTGVIKSGWKKFKDRIIKQSINCWGYPVMHIRLKDKGYHRCVHTIMAHTFLELPKGYGYKDLTVNHKDGNKQNNNIENLEYCTFQANQLHRHDYYLQPKTKGPVDHNVYLFRHDDGREFIGSPRELYHTYKESDRLFQQGIRNMIKGINPNNGNNVTQHKGWRKVELLETFDERKTYGLVFYRAIPGTEFEERRNPVHRNRKLY